MLIPIPALAQIELLILIFLRISSMFVLIPIFGDKTVPMRVKAGLSIIITFIVFSFLRQGVPPVVSENLLIFAMKVAGEIMIGALIGLIGRFLFVGLQLCGQLIGFQMGFSIANVVDPVTSAHVSIIAELYYLIAVLLFLAFDMHHLFILAITESFQIIPPFGFRFKGELVQALLAFSGNIFVIAVKIGAPVIAALTFMNVGLGIIARTVPQINIFIVGFPLQIMTGLLFIGLSSALLSAGMEKLFAQLSQQISAILRLMP